jgi:hypothetical protein
LVLVACAQAAAPAAPPKDQPSGSPLDCAPAQGEPAPIAKARLYVEYNSTDGDLGVHGAFDDHGYSELCVYDPNGVLVLALKPQGQLQDLSMAGIFFESREPPLEEFGFADLKARFPEGQYEVRARNFDGTGLIGAASFTHAIPAAPEVLRPAVADEELAAEAVVPIEGLVIEWADVGATVDGSPVTITAYEVIVTKVEHSDPHGYSQPILDVHVPSDRNSLRVPVEFLEPATLYELEVLAIEQSGNQTITVGFFTTE